MRSRFALLAFVVALPIVALIFGGDAPVRSADEAKPAAKLTLKPGDHICIIGNTLADRMQHDGWLETYLHSRFPKHDLVFRNLGFAADGVNLKDRDRSAN